MIFENGGIIGANPIGKSGVWDLMAAFVNYGLTTAGTGGIVTYDGTYKYHTFNSDDTFTVTASGSVDYLIVAGGGGGGSDFGGGAGAGGVRYGSTAVDKTDYTITVGGGGSGATSAGSQAGNGGDSSGFSITSTGGGGASNGSGDYPGGSSQTGGSGGGGGAYETSANPAAAGNTPSTTPRQGNDGGDGYGGDGDTSSTGGGGGGASSAGAAGVSGTGGNGGAGYQWLDSNYYGGGGGGGAYQTTTAGSGGIGGGGAGANGSNNTGTAGAVNTGGGGGGSSGGGSGAGGDGGSGIVIIRYLSSAVAAIYSNPEATLGTATYTTTGALGSYSVGSSLYADFVVCIDIQIDTSSSGVIWEAGGTTRGAGIAFDGTNIRAGAFYTGSNWGGADYANITADFTTYLDTFGTFIFTGDYSAGSINLYWMEGGVDSGNEAILLGTGTGGGNGAIWGSNNAGFLTPTSGNIQDFGFSGDTNGYNGTTTGAEARIWTSVTEPSPLQTS